MSDELRGLLDFVYGAENGGKVNYDTIYGGLTQAGIRPPKPVSQMTVGDVLEWQYSLGKRDRPVGAIQIIPGTLKQEISKGTVSPDDIFNGETQDRLSVSLMKKRGLDQWQKGSMTTEQFGTRLAMEWASLPVLQNTFRGSKAIQRGQAYYGGVGANKSRALVPTSAFEDVLGDPGRTIDLSQYGPTGTPGTRMTNPAGGRLNSGAGRRLTRQWENTPLDPTRHYDQWKVPVVNMRGDGSTTFQNMNGNTPAIDVDPVNDFTYSNRYNRGDGVLQSGGTAFMDKFTDGFIVREAQDRLSRSQYESDLSFDPVKEAILDGNRANWKFLSTARNKEHYDFLVKKLDEEADRQKRMAAWNGVGMQTLGAILNPDTLVSMVIPLGVGVSAVGRGAAVRASALRATAYTGAYEAGIEAGRSRLDPNSTAADSVIRAGGATILAGLLGGGISAVGSQAARRRLMDDVAQNFARTGDVYISPTKSVDLGLGVKGQVHIDSVTGESVVTRVDSAPSATNNVKVFSDADGNPIVSVHAVTIKNGRVEINDEAILKSFADGTHGTDARTATELAEHSIQYAAELYRGVKKFVKGESGAVGPQTPRKIVKVNAAGDLEIDIPALKQAIKDDDLISVGSLNEKSRIKPISIQAKKLGTPKQAAATVKKLQEAAGKARDNNEFERMASVILGGDKKLAQAIDPKLRAATVEAERVAKVKADEALLKFREKNNRVLQDVKVEALSRMMDSAYKRGHRNSWSHVVRDLFDKLAADGAFLRGSDETGIGVGTSVYSRKKRWDGVVDRVTREENRLYEQYLGFNSNPNVADISLRRAQSQMSSAPKTATGEQAIKVAEFNRRATIAHITGEKDAIPQINEMVEVIRGAYREFEVVADEYGVLDGAITLSRKANRVDAQIDELNTSLDEFGSLTEKQENWMADLKVQKAELAKRLDHMKTDPKEDYFTRVWNAKAISENRDWVKETIIKPWMRQQPRFQVWIKGREEYLDELRSLHMAGVSDQAPEAVKIRKLMADAPKKSRMEWKEGRLDGKGLDERADALMNQIMQEAEPEDLAMTREGHRPTFSRRRQFDIPNEMLLKDGPKGNGKIDLIETDYNLNVKIYADRMGPAIEMARSFARPVDGVNWIEGFQEAMDLAKSAERRAWDKGRELKGEKPVISNYENANPTFRKKLDDMGLTGIRIEELKHKNPKMRGMYYDGTIYLRKGAGEAVLYHEAFHAMFAEAKLTTKLNLFRKSLAARKFEPILKLKERYADQFKAQRDAGMKLVETDEYMAKMFGYWSRRPDKDFVMEEFVDFANAQLRKDIGAEAPQIKLSQREINMLDDTFRRLKSKADLDFADHWSPMERDLLHLKDRVTNRVIRDPNRWDNRTATSLRNWSQLAFMGMSGLPAIQEVGTLMMRHGVRQIWQSALTELDDVTKAVHAAGIKEMRAAGAILDVAMGSSLSRFAETGIDATTGTAAERWLKTSANKYFLWNGLAPITTRLKEMDAALRVTDMLTRIKRVSDLGAKASPADLAELNRWGITRKKAEAMAQQPMEQLDGVEGAWIANTDMWGDEGLVTDFRAAIAQGNENTILMATAADKPTIVDGVIYLRKNATVNKYAARAGLEEQGDYWRVQSGMMSLPFGFWNYGIAATNKVFLAGLDEPSSQALGGIAALVGMGYMVAQVRTPDFAWDNKNVGAKALAAVEQSGIVGVLPLYANLLQDTAIGITGKNIMPYEPINGRYPSAVESIVGAAGAGPSVAGNLVGGVATGDINQASWAMPFRNFWLTKGLMDSAVEGLERGRN